MINSIGPHQTLISLQKVDLVFPNKLPTNVLMQFDLLNVGMSISLAILSVCSSHEYTGNILELIFPTNGS